MARQAKCPSCKIRYVWGKRLTLKGRGLYCPRCGDRLKQTNMYVKLPVVYKRPNRKGGRQI